MNPEIEIRRNNLHLSNNHNIEKNKNNLKKSSVNQKVKKIDSLIVSVICIVTFFIPWVFTHYTYEFYEITKNTFLIVGLVILIILWAVKIFRTKKVTLVRTPLDIPILVYLLTQIISVIFSINKETSIWGYYSRFTGGLISNVALILFYYVIVNNADKKKAVRNIIISLLVSVTLLALFTILKSFGIFYDLFEGLGNSHPSLEFLNYFIFSPVGNPNLLPFIFVSILPIAVSFISRDDENFTKDIYAVISSSIILFAIGLTSISDLSLYGVIIWFLVLVIIIVSFVYKAPVTKELVLKYCPVILFAVFAVLFSFSQGVRGMFSSDISFSKYQNVPFNTDWTIVTETFREYKIKGFLIGTGLDTYPYNFARFRPAEQNLEANWYQSYTRSSAQVYDLLSNNGIIGFASFILLGILVFLFILKNILKREINNSKIGYVFGIGLSILAIIVISFLEVFTISVSFIMWLLLGILIISYYLQNERVKESYEVSLLLSKSKVAIENEKNVISYFLGGVFILFSLISIFFILNNYRAEVHYKKSQIAVGFNAVDEANDHIVKAINKNKNRDYYHRQMAYVGLQALRNSIPAAGEEYTDNLQTYHSYLISLIKDELNTTIELNNLNWSNWETAALIYKQLVDLTDGQSYGNETLYAASQAINLNPSNPDNYIILGYIYQYNEDEDLQTQAEQIFIQAYSLRPDYSLSVFALGNYFEYAGEFDEALALYQNTVENYYPNESDMNTLLLDRIEALEEKKLSLEEENDELIGIEESDEEGQLEPTDEDITQEVEENLTP